MHSRTKRQPVLAVEGGPATRTRPFAPWPCFEAEEIEAVHQVLKSGAINYWTGNEGREFEKEYAAYVGCRHAVALANGTAALELALYALGVGPGDEVVTTSRTFIASASCVVMRGARPVFADVDRDSGNLTAESVRAALSPRTKAIIAVHLAGWPCDMDPLVRLAEEHGLALIEDCAQAHGATYKGRPVGSFGHAAAFSFCQDKIITTGGEGGMLVTNDTGVWERAWAYKDHGKSYAAVYSSNHASGFRWLHESFGTNWRLTEMQSAIGRVLLHKLEAQVAKRRELAALLAGRLAAIPALRVSVPSADFGHSYYKFYAYLRPARLRAGWTRDRIMDAITAEGVPCFAGSCSEVYLEKAFPPELRPARRLPVAKELGETSLMFLVHPTLREQDMRDTANAVEKVLSVAAS
ncbi:MAG: DegT/DnrJ/EryC1/StrS family aminotransferase [Terriglobales bacterium]